MKRKYRLVLTKTNYVWRKKVERLHLDCVVVVPNKDGNVKFSAMFWGCITYFGVGTLTPVGWNINSEKYISILVDNVWPVVAWHFANNPWTLQEDNAPCHASQQTTAWKTEFYLYLGLLKAQILTLLKMSVKKLKKKHCKTNFGNPNQRRFSMSC